ncbi:SMI1/KNR4 family protein [Aeoliella sp.]|uniref:SMI1/KNR4 family protein n=1 Tax=Aeoliella sp. TaxID=2795800 RepID=UPI003CCBD817
MAIKIGVKLLDSGICRASEIKGCKEVDLRAIEVSIDAQLPKAYTAIMKEIGRGCGEFLSDVQMFYPAVLGLTEVARTMVSGHLALPADAFVFASRYGEQFLFFHTGTSEDAEVFRWSDDEPEQFRKVFESIWDFIEEELIAHLGVQ